MYTIPEIAGIINAELLRQHTGGIIDHLLLDSRKLLFPKTSLFFAIDGPRRSGNLFIAELYNKGVRSFVVNQNFDRDKISGFPDADFLLVSDVLHALQELAAYHRSQFTIPIIGITGSNGKTIVKEWLYQLLNTDHIIVRSPKSYNSQIGVPLSVWPMNKAHTLGIFEAGISQPGEMQRLEKIIAPFIGIFTNIGEAHSEGFSNIRQKITEKLKLFLHSKIIIYNTDDSLIANEVNNLINGIPEDSRRQLFTWGKKETATLQVNSVERKALHTSITARYKNKQQTITIPFTDDASVENAITCWCVLLHFNISGDEIDKRMQQLRPVEMRLELKNGINNCSIINDSYSADINSLSIALDFLYQQQQHPNRTLILSDILQSGKSSDALYADVAAMLAQKKINRFIGIGHEIASHQNAFAGIPHSSFFSSIEDFKKRFHALHFINETILLKGARVFEFEQISHLLEEKVHQTVLEISLTSITHNLKQYQQLLKPGVKLMAMVKAFSYGSGSFEIANLLQFHKVDYLAVAFVDEGVELRKAGITLPIMVMSPENAVFDVMVQYGLEPELYSFNSLLEFRDYLLASGIDNYPVHIKLDTGMHRLGFEEADISRLGTILQTSSSLKVQSVFSHFAASDTESMDDFTHQQFDLFMKWCNTLQQGIDYTFIRHIANTSAIMRHADMQLGMVRLGIGLYGVDSNPLMQNQLSNVTTLKSTIAQTRKVKAGESVGYNRAGIVSEDAMIATVRIGYADGYPRKLGNGNGNMLVNGVAAPVIGNVCMDMTMINITGIEAKEGDEVIVFGKDHPVTDVAKRAGTIAYEILAGISQRVKRVYFEES